MAEKPCNTCQNYDVIKVGKDKEARHGRCVPKSTYPAVQQRGQKFPPGAKRAEHGELAKPFIVVGSEVQTSCTDYRAKPLSITKKAK